MLEFPTTPPRPPEVTDASRRVEDFEEIYAGFNPAQAAEQAARCSQCGVPFCQVHCPLQNNIPDWLRLAAEGRLREAYEMSASTNNFPEICGRICPQDRLCEGNCVIEKGFGAVTIGAVEKYITENAFQEGWVKPAAPARESGSSIGIIGAGPAGLAAADMLRAKGHAVHVYDRHDRAGGLLTYGIPNFKLDKSVVARREALLRDGGIQFHLGEDIAGLSELRARHHAVLIATGVYRAREQRMPNDTLSGIIPALPFLMQQNKRDMGIENTAPAAAGKHVVVIGGGDTAMDCVRTAIRQGAASVTCLYRRDRANMPGSAREVKNAEEEGVTFSWLAAPKAFIGDACVEGVLVQRMRLTAPDTSGRQGVALVENETYTLKADMVIMALGFDAEDLPTLWNEPALRVTRHGTLEVKDFHTALPGVFAAGDIVRGASLVVWAIRDGREAADAMHRYLMAQAKVAA